MVFASAVTFLWGLSDACLTNFYLCVCGFQFDSKTLPYSVLRSVQSFSTFIFIYLESLVKNKLQFNIYLGVTAVFTVFAWLIFAFTFDMREVKP